MNSSNSSQYDLKVSNSFLFPVRIDSSISLSFSVDMLQCNVFFTLLNNDSTLQVIAITHFILMIKSNNVVLYLFLSQSLLVQLLNLFLLVLWFIWIPFDFNILIFFLNNSLKLAVFSFKYFIWSFLLFLMSILTTIIWIISLLSFSFCLYSSGNSKQFCLPNLLPFLFFLLSFSFLNRFQCTLALLLCNTCTIFLHYQIVHIIKSYWIHMIMYNECSSYVIYLAY